MSGTGGLNTNLNQPNYFNDFSSNNDYYYYLYKPETAVQVRELNGQQSVMYDQIKKFGDNIFTSGTIISGCSITMHNNLSYVKLQDNYANGFSLNVTALQGYTAVSNSGLIAYIFDTQQGYVLNAPNLNTLFIKYLNSSTNTTIKLFQNDEVLTIYNSANISVGQVTVANTISSGSSNTTGLGYALSVDNGVIYQKGMFLNVNQQTLIINAYSNFVDGVSVGFNSLEQIVTVYQDPTLYDNSQGVPNPTAPGADRLQITPQLVSINSNTINGNNFFSIVDFVGGSPSIVNQDTSYSVIGQKIAQVSSDTNGDFVINPFNTRTLQLYLANGNIDTQNMKLEIDRGLAYIDGNRIQVTGKLLGVLAKGVDTGQVNSAILTAQYGSYVIVQDVAGTFDPTIIETVYLQSANAFGVSNGIVKGVAVASIAAPGTTIGNASLIMISYYQGIPNTPTGQYLAYLFNIQMSGANSFSSVMSLYANTGTNIGVADIQRGTSSTTSLYNTNTSLLIYPMNSNAVSTLKTSSNAIDTQYIFKTSTGVNFPTGGTVTVTIPTHSGGTNQLPYGVGVLPTTSLNDFTVIATANAHSSNIAGSANATAASNAATGPTTSLYAGALISFANASSSEIKEVATIVSPTSYTTTVPFTNSWLNANVYFSYISGERIPLFAMNANVNILSSSSFSINLNETLNTTMTANVFYNVLRTQAVPRKKSLQTSCWACIDCSNNAGGIIGPWCLGFPDIFNVNEVYVGTNFSTSNPTSNNWSLNNGQSDLSYNLGYLNNRGMTLTTSSRILVNFSCFLQDLSVGEGFYSVDSYPVGTGANTIYLQDIPLYYSTKAQQSYDLRNCVDFRVYVANTIQLISSIANIPTTGNTLIYNPNTAITYQTTNMTLPRADSQFETSYQYYMGRYDTIGLSNTATILTTRGTPSTNPVPPGDLSNGLTLGTVYIPPFPSITPDVIDTNMRNGYPQTSITLKNNRRYTMSDIAFLDSEIQQLQYYTSLSVLEASAKNLLLTNANGTNRFQNGILADPMQDFSIANTADPTFNIAIDAINDVARPVVNAVPVQLNYVIVTGDNVELSSDGSLITLDYTPTIGYISQPFCSNTRNPSCDSLYTWSGRCRLAFEGHWCPDLDHAPLITSFWPGYSNWFDCPNPWQTAFGWWKENDFYNISYNGTYNQDITAGSLSPHGNGLITYGTPSANNICYVDNNPIIQPYCRANMIKFNCYGLKPNTRYYPYLDDDMIAQYCIQTDEEFNILNTFNLISDERGALFGYYWIPPGTFYAGSRNFQICDIGSFAVEGAVITSYCGYNYYGTNMAFLNYYGIPLDQSGIAQVADLYTRPCQPALATICSPLVLTAPTTNTSSIPNYANSANAIALPTGTISTSTPIVTEVATGFTPIYQPLFGPFGHPTPYYHGFGPPFWGDGWYLNYNGPRGPFFPSLLAAEGWPYIPLVYPYGSILSLNQGLYYEAALLASEYIWTCGIVPGITPVVGSAAPSNVGGGCGDNISQTFTILASSVPSGVTCVYLTSIDVFFHTKDTVFGVVIDVRGCTVGGGIYHDGQGNPPGPGGGPDFYTLPLAFVHLWPEEIAISVDATVKQTINFPAPILLQVGQSYSFTITPDGYTPNYLIHSAVLNENDLISKAPIYAFAPCGNLWLLSQGSVWNAYTQESLKYNVNIAMFNPLSGMVAFQNDNSEYLQIQSTTGIIGTNNVLYFANQSNNALSSASVTLSSNTVTVGTGNTVGLNNTSKVMITSGASLGGFVANVVSVTSGTQFVINPASIFSDSLTCNVYNITGNPTAIAAFVNSTFLVANNSTASATNYLSNTYDYTVLDSYAGGYTSAVQLIDVPYDIIMPKFSTSIPSLCSINMAMLGTSNGSTSYVQDSSLTNLTIGSDTTFYDEERVVMSRSNEVSYKSGTKSLTLVAQMSTTSSWESPAFDTIKMGAILIENIINAETGNTVFLSEINNSGNAINRYISSTVPLASGLSASDLQVYVGAYWPANTNIYVYAKVLNQYDSTPMISAYWTPMYTTNTVRSAKANLTDFNEYLFTFSNTAPTTNTANVAAFTAYLNSSNNNVVTYNNTLNQTFTTFETFEIKIVLLADASDVVPMISDYRAIAVT